MWLPSTVAGPGPGAGGALGGPGPAGGRSETGVTSVALLKSVEGGMAWAPGSGGGLVDCGGGAAEGGAGGVVGGVGEGRVGGGGEGHSVSVLPVTGTRPGGRSEIVFQ